MKYAICNETFKDWEFEDAFRMAVESGYGGIEFAPFTIHPDVRQISADKRAEIRAQLTSFGLESIGLHWLLAFTEGYYLTTADEAVRRETTRYLADLARLCRDLGGTIMVLGSPQQRNLLPGIDHDTGSDYAAEVLKGVVPVLEECEVQIAVEPLSPAEGDFLNTARLGAELVRKVDSAAVQLHLDVKAMSSEPEEIVDIIRDHHEMMIHFHANDANLRGPGMGEIDFVPILQTLKDVQYDGWVSVEVFDYEPGVEALCQESIEYLQECEAQLS